jgi:hypothetical protein
LALWLAAFGSEVTPAMADNGPSLTIDPCVAVDEKTVREVIELEIRGARMLHASVSVRCVDGAQEIRVLPWISPETEGIRTINLPPVADDDDVAVRQARSRELALAIAEYIRRLDAAQHLTRESQKPKPLPTPPPLVPAPTMPATPPTPDGRWQLGLLSAFEYFSGGQTLAGGDLFVASGLGRWFSAELRAGGRIGADEPLPGGRLTTRAATASTAVGFSLWSQRRPVGAALVLRAQGYLVQFRVEQFGEGRAPTALLGALTLAAEPRIAVTLTRHLLLEASAGAGFPLHGIVVRTQGTENRSMSGLVVSGSLGGVVSF